MAGYVRHARCALVGGLFFIVMILVVNLKLMGCATPAWFSVVLSIFALILLQTGALNLMVVLMGVARGGSVAHTN
jgi:hypothetical protein